MQAVLAVFFGVVTPCEIEWWEALVLFLMYGGYAVFMKFNVEVRLTLTLTPSRTRTPTLTRTLTPAP